MFNKNNVFWIFVAIGLIVFSSCTKENMDDTTTDDNVDPQTVVCNLEVSLSENAEGVLTANIEGANPPVAYLWSNESTENSISTTPSTAYSVVVVDADGCTAETNITTAPEEGDDCNAFAVVINENDGGDFIANVSGGTAPYTYLWSDGSIGSTITPEGNVTYTVSVEDANGCTYEVSTEVNIDCSSLAVTISEDENGNLVAEIAGGTAPFLYEWSDGSIGSTTTPNNSGNYTVSVIDANGCAVQTSTEISVGCNSLLEIFIYQDNNGNLLTEIGGGTPPYVYEWSDGSMTEMTTPDGVTTVYTVTVVDVNGCIAENSIEVDSADPCNSLEVVIFPDGNGNLIAEVSGGTPPYVYEWSNGSIGNIATIDGSGSYTVWTTDANGCTTENNIVITVEGGVCNDNVLALQAATNMPLNFSAASEGYLFKESCSEISNYTPDYDHNYIIVDVIWNSWGTGNPIGYFDPSDGIPGITFGSNGMPQVGDVLTAYAPFEPLFNNGTAPYIAYITQDVVVTITETGDQVGESISGTISGTVTNQNDPSDTANVTGTFCVPIVSVCE